MIKINVNYKKCIRITIIITIIHFFLKGAETGIFQTIYAYIIMRIIA
jgi:hypothetical protein